MSDQKQTTQNRLNQIIEGLKFTADELYEITFERDKLREANGELVIKLDKFRHKNAELLEALEAIMSIPVRLDDLTSEDAISIKKAKAIIKKLKGN